MPRINANYLDLPGSYLFAEVGRRVALYALNHPDHKLIRLGIGDVPGPLAPSVLAALREAVDEQGTEQGFRGYGPEQGYAFLREAVAEACYAGLGITPDDIFISDGAKCDLGNFQELFSADCRVAVTDPVYPVYVDSNVMAGRGGQYHEPGLFKRIIYLPCTAANGFVPDLPAEKPDVVYLCYPNNPTGTALNKEQLARWVEYARESDATIFFDAAYEAFISTPGIPHSIYEIEGAAEVAVEFRSYSKTAGFTGLRCGFAVVPPQVCGTAPDGRKIPLRDLWLRRQTTKYNGCPYIVQRAAAAAHTERGRAETMAAVRGYMENAALIRRTLLDLGFQAVGGTDAPYVWLTLPEGMDSWSFFDRLLSGAGVVGTPGAGFGPSGAGCFRLTGFSGAEPTREALERIKSLKL